MEIKGSQTTKDNPAQTLDSFTQRVIPPNGEGTSGPLIGETTTLPTVMSAATGAPTMMSAATGAVDKTPALESSITTPESTVTGSGVTPQETPAWR